MAVRIERDGDIAIVRLDSPPVNAIGAHVRVALMTAVETLSNEATLKGVVLTGSASIFAAGADTREFDAAPVPPHLPDVVAAIERSPQPWIAAIYGTALGGGCELVLGCRQRVAAPNATFGLPEVTLGVVPGAGGTQRLPRLVGLKAALDMVVFGKVHSAKAALEIGLIDSIEENPVAAAKALLSETKRSFPETLSQRAPCVPVPEAVSTARGQALRRMRGQIAPLRAIDLVELAAQAEFAAGINQERQIFLDLRTSDQARALRHIFFAERGARTPTWLKQVNPVDVRTVVVVGGGTMGAGITYALERAGYGVTLLEADDKARHRAQNNVRLLFNDAVKRGLLSDSDAKNFFSDIKFVIGYEQLPEADLAIEAVFEDMDVKKNVIRDLERVLPAHAVLATNTSYLDINEIAAATSRPDKVLGLHFFSPAHIMRLLEIVKGERTSDEALASAFQIAKKLNKIPVLTGVCDGFIGNRILARYREEADVLIMDGAMPWTIDTAMVNFGMAMGPYQVQDLSGLDIAYAQRRRKAAGRDPNRRYIPIADRMVRDGRLGKKTGLGWYRYAEDGLPVADRLVEDLISDEARLAKISRRNISEEEIRTRLTVAMINEAADILHEGIAASASDIDLVFVHGYGFPRWRGGPMFYADTVGTAPILNRVEMFAREDPVMWKPSPLLRELAAVNKPFATWKHE